MITRYNYSKKMQKPCINTILILTIITIFLLCNTPMESFAQDNNVEVFTNDSQPFGSSYGEWIAKWWQWNVNIPAKDHPRDFYSMDKCNINQSGPVWFMPDILQGIETRNCKIPANTSVLIPIQTGAQWNDGNGGFLNDQQLLERAMEFQDNTKTENIKATLDGKEIKVPRVQSPFFDLTIPIDSWTRGIVDEDGSSTCPDCIPGTFRAVADGYFIFLAPLDPGEYDVGLYFFTQENPNPFVVSQLKTYTANATYHLIVEPSSNQTG